MGAAWRGAWLSRHTPDLLLHSRACEHRSTCLGCQATQRRPTNPRCGSWPSKSPHVPPTLKRTTSANERSELVACRSSERTTPKSSPTRTARRPPAPSLTRVAVASAPRASPEWTFSGHLQGRLRRARQGLRITRGESTSGILARSPNRLPTGRSRGGGGGSKARWRRRTADPGDGAPKRALLRRRNGG